MNYLVRYLSTLREEQQSAFQNIRFSERELEVLRLLLERRRDPEATKQQAAADLRMSSSMFDKSCSTILRKILEYFAPSGGLDLLSHLAGQPAIDLLQHETKRLEKEMSEGDHTHEQRIAFYASLVEIIHRRFSSEHPAAMAQEIVARYLALDQSLGAKVFAEAIVLRLAIWTEAANRTGDERLQEL